MKRVKLMATACCTAVLALTLVFTATAQDFNTNERTYLTFSAPVELPGATLPAGTYLFKLADSMTNRHIIQVFDRDEKQIFATILAVPAERMEVTGENVITFRESAEGQTPAVKYWYYPGDKIGHEFVYPRGQAAQIAERTGEDVLSTEGEVASANSAVSSMGPDGQTSEWEREGAATTTAEAETETGAVAGTTGVSEMPEQPEAEQAEAGSETINPESETIDPEEETPPAEPGMTAQAPTTTEPQTTEPAAPTTTTEQAVGTSGQAEPMAQDQASRDRANELPRTASPLPLAGLIGLLSLGGAAALRKIRR